MNRRDFLSLLGKGAVALAAAPLVPLPAAATAPTWEKIVACTTPLPTDKIALLKAMLANAIKAHDDMIEKAIFTGVPYP